MYEIRFYYKNHDKNNNNKKVVFHPYESFENYDDACLEMLRIQKLFEVLGATERVFTYECPKDLETYVLALSEEGKDLATIVEV